MLMLMFNSTAMISIDLRVMILSTAVLHYYSITIIIH